jgi:hypothetical protein
MRLEDIAMAFTAYIIMKSINEWAKTMTDVGCLCGFVALVGYIASMLYLLFFMVQSVRCYFGG